MVEFTFALPDGRPARLARSVISGGSRLSVDGVDMARSNGPERPFLVPLRDGGGTARVVVRGRGYDYAPTLLLDGKEIPIARRLAPWEYALAALPILLIFAGGLVGAVVGFAAMAVNQRLLRATWPYVARVAATLGITVAGYAVVVAIIVVIQVALAMSGGGT